jgi:flagellar FliL protein
VRAWIALLLALSLPVMALAEDEKAPAGATQVSYVSLVPPLVGNYQSSGRLKLYKADISLRVGSPEAQARVEHHEPLIRNQLVMLFSQQTEASLSGLEAKENLRQQALTQVQQALEQEESQPLVEDLLFNNLIIQ